MLQLTAKKGGAHIREGNGGAGGRNGSPQQGSGALGPLPSDGGARNMQLPEAQGGVRQAQGSPNPPPRQLPADARMGSRSWRPARSAGRLTPAQLLADRVLERLLLEPEEPRVARVLRLSSLRV